MANDFNILEFLQTENDIEKVKEKLFLYHQLLQNAVSDRDVYTFLLSMFNLGVAFEPCENPLVSIIIPVKNEFIVTEFLLNSIHSYTKNIPYEVIIADDNSQDQTTEIKNYFPNIKVVMNDINTPGFLYNVSNAIGYARGKYILLLNNDMMVFENYLDEMLKVIEKYPDIGIVGAKNISLENKIQECGAIISQDIKITYIGRDEDINFMDDKEYIDCDYCSGCSILFKKETWDKAGGFDKEYAPAYYEDSDFALNVKYNLGLKSVCAPKAKIYHYKSVSYIKDYKYRLSISKNKTHFKEKWEKYLNKE